MAALQRHRQVLADPAALLVQGRINKSDIDARMLKALADLPVDLGIEAIDKFAMASLDSIRSKTGFMVGFTSTLEEACQQWSKSPRKRPSSDWLLRAVQMGIIKRIQQDLSGRYRDPYPRDRWVCT